MLNRTSQACVGLLALALVTACSDSQLNLAEKQAALEKRERELTATRERLEAQSAPLQTRDEAWRQREEIAQRLSAQCVATQVKVAALEKELQAVHAVA